MTTEKTTNLWGLILSYSSVHIDILNAFMPGDGIRCDKKSLKAWIQRIDDDYIANPGKYVIIDGVLVLRNIDA